MTKSWWGLQGRNDSAAMAAYKFADDKPSYLQQVEPPRSCATRVADAAAATQAAIGTCARKLLCFRSFWWSMPLAFASFGLSIAWFVMILIIDSDTLDAHYGFKPLPSTAYFKWGLAMYIIVPVLWIPMFATLCMRGKRASRWTVGVVITVFAILLVIGNVLSAKHTRDRRASTRDFAAEFNALYCDARSTHACLVNAKPTDMLALAGIDNATALNAAPNATAGALAVLAHCSSAILRSMDRDATSIVSDPIVYVPMDDIKQLIADADASSDTVAWCGRRAQLLSAGEALSDAEQQASAAPFASNGDMFEHYVHEWPRRMLYANVLLSSAIGCMVLAAVSWTIHDKTDSNY